MVQLQAWLKEISGFAGISCNQPTEHTENSSWMIMRAYHQAAMTRSAPNLVRIQPMGPICHVQHERFESGQFSLRRTRGMSKWIN
jgi:hypothetical protein